jgi:hypothetical protein
MMCRRNSITSLEDQIAALANAIDDDKADAEAPATRAA